MPYKMPSYRSSNIFATRVFWRLRNHTFDGHISGLDQDRDNLKPLLPTSRLRPIDWYQCRVCHVTILLPVWRFWPLGVIKTVRNGCLVMSTVVGLVRGRGSNVAPYWESRRCSGPHISPTEGPGAPQFFLTVGPQGAYLSSKHGVPPVRGRGGVIFLVNFTKMLGQNRGTLSRKNYYPH